MANGITENEMKTYRIEFNDHDAEGRGTDEQDALDRYMAETGLIANVSLAGYEDDHIVFDVACHSASFGGEARVYEVQS